MFGRRSEPAEGLTFTDDVRNALVGAREEAIRRGNGRIDPEHILLGVLPHDRVFGVLQRAGVRPEAVDKLMKAVLPEGDTPGNPGELPYSRGAKRVLELTMAAARERRSRTVDVEHLLVGVLEEPSSAAGGVLRKFGLTASRILSDAPPSARPGKARFRVPLDDTSDRSIYEQIVARVTEAVATGELGRGERLPTVRRLADELDVAPGTVARAYSELEQQGIVATEGARGTRVADRPSDTRPWGTGPDSLSDLLRPVAIAAYHLGAREHELRAALEQAMVGIFDRDEPSA